MSTFYKAHLKKYTVRVFRETTVSFTTTVMASDEEQAEEMGRIEAEAQHPNNWEETGFSSGVSGVLVKDEDGRIKGIK